MSALFVEALLTDALARVPVDPGRDVPSVASVLSLLRASRMHRAPLLAECLRRTRAAATSSAGRADADTRVVQAVAMLRFLSESSSLSYRNEISDVVLQETASSRLPALSATGKVIDACLPLRGYTSTLRGKKVRERESARERESDRDLFICYIYAPNNMYDSF